MQVTNVSSYAGVAALQSKQNTDGTNGADFFLEMEEEADPIAAVMATYDLTNITPAEIDQLVDELKAAGHPFDENLLMLSSRGAGFRSHLAGLAGGDYDPHQRVNLVDLTQDQLAMARRFEDPTESIERFLEFLKVHDKGEALNADAMQQRLMHESMMRQMIGARAG
ncbi:hypothetical protein [Hyphococcus luteus]|uniref:Uncharacterized protein n=1 Tax=Hyphococcus luteus TaxID=2058213 RepID=A0A2S7K7Q7_9PROT|nr:hypothetical protein [Marinicaulis flavus]PQA88498.1 hypothetical protein CW354_09425 [Marinicaulis flavus]